jgi:hypothetical protein
VAQRKVTILDKAVQEVAHVAYFIESKGLPETAKKFVGEAFQYFEKLGEDSIKHRPCKYLPWKIEGFRCVTLKKKFTIAFIDTQREIVIVDFSSVGILKSI